MSLDVTAHNKTTKKIKVTKNGPYIVSGETPIAEQTIIADNDETAIEWRETKIIPSKKLYPYVAAVNQRISLFVTEPITK